MELTHLSIPISFSSAGARSPGIHLSGILTRMAVAQGIYPAQLPPSPPSPPSPSTNGISTPSLDPRSVKRATGLAWEDWLAPRLAPHFPDFSYHPGEYLVDGIYMSPDAIHFEPSGEIILHEIKASYYSSKQTQNPTEKLIVWLWQGMGYLYGLSEASGQRCTTCIYHPNFLMGDYSRGNGITPQYSPFRVTFEWEEICTLWKLVLANKRLADPETGQLQEQSFTE